MKTLFENLLFVSPVLKLISDLLQIFPFSHHYNCCKFISGCCLLAPFRTKAQYHQMPGDNQVSLSPLQELP